MPNQTTLPPDDGNPKTELVLTREETVPSFPISFTAVEDRLKEMQAFVASQLKENQDYGAIPGVKKKFMWLSGAEKVSAAMGWGASMAIEERVEHESNGIGCPSQSEARQQHLYVRVRCELYDKRTGTTILTKFGSCDSGEIGFRRQLGVLRTIQDKVLDEAGKPIWDHANCPVDMNGKPVRGQHKRQGRTTCRPKTVVSKDTHNPICIHDLTHNIEQRANKRAFVSAVVYAARLGFQFSYDEDLVDEVRDRSEGQQAEKVVEVVVKAPEPKPVTPEPEPPKKAVRKKAARRAAAPRREPEPEPEPEPELELEPEPIATETVAALEGQDSEPQGLPAKSYCPTTGELLLSQNGIDYPAWLQKGEDARKADGDCTKGQLLMLGAMVKKHSIDTKALQAVIRERWPEVKRSWQLAKASLGEILDEIMS